MHAARFLIGLVLLTGVATCKRSSGDAGGGWLVGASGLMRSIRPDHVAGGFVPPARHNLNAIAAHNADEAWVAGDHGTLLYTANGGATWQSPAVATTADLRSVATSNLGPVFVVGNGVFLVSRDTGEHWRDAGDGVTKYRSVAAAQDADTVLAISDDGGVWSYEHGRLIRRTHVLGARTVAVSPDGAIAVAVGDDVIARSSDGGHTWSRLLTRDHVRYDDVRIDASGQAVAVGSAGAITHVAFDGSVVTQHLGAVDFHSVHIASIGEIGENYETVGYVAGDGGRTWVTRDGGWSWAEGPNVGQTVLGIDELAASRR
ncbi:MAG TPA: hypothetical protein VFP84_17605 [Kofleriaceae bacterium]|nr:hypothetical protein [Kofleriaceae bacterium]